MEKIYAENNGRPVYNNDLILIQGEALDAAKAAWIGRGAFILSGCNVSGANIASGLVFINSEIMRFNGATGVSFPYYIFQNATTLTTFRAYNDSISRATREMIEATGGNSIPFSGEYITMTSGSGRVLRNAFETDFVTVVGTQTVAGNKTLTGNNTYSGTSTFTGAVTNSNTINGGGTIAITNTIQGTRFISTVSTGTAPLSVSSTTKVTSLNADLLDGLDSTAFAGVGVSISAGTGLTGGGDLSTNRTISVASQGITTGLIADGNVTTAKIADSNITTAKIADSNVTTAKIANFNVTTDKLNEGAVTSSKIASEAVTFGKLGPGSVLTSKIADGNVTNSKLATNSVATANIQDVNVTTAKLANNAVTVAKLADDVIDLSRGSSSASTNLVNFTNHQQLGSKTYTRTLWNLTRNSARLRPYVKAQFMAMRDSGGADVIQCVLQRNPNPDTGGVWSTIHTRSYRLDGDSWTTILVDTIDTSATAGDNYYRVVVTVTTGSLCYLSDSINYLVFGVPHY
jgi:hypothetical protein